MLEKIVDALLHNAGLALVVIGLIVLVIGAASGYPELALNVDELGWRLALAAIGIIVAIVGVVVILIQLPSFKAISRNAYGIEITSPKQGEDINVDYEVVGTYKKKLPDGVVLQLFHGPARAEEYWPIVEANAIFDEDTKTWSTMARTGGEPAPRDIVVMLMGRAGQALCKYYRKVGEETSQWPGIDTLTPDMVECDRVTVRRV